MSKMLQEAIIDAEALKEAALRNAEQVVVEKYEAEIREAVTALLEQPEDELGLGEEDPLGMDLGGEPGMESDEAVADQLAAAAVDGENLCPCPDMEDPITGGAVEVDLDQLVAAAAAEEEAEEESAESMGLTSGMALEEEIDLDEDMLAKLIEELTVDVAPQSNGWTGATAGDMDEAFEQAVAEERDTEVSEENEELRKNVKDLEESIKRYAKRIKVLRSQKNEMNEKKNKIRKVALKMRGHVDGVNLQNARLLYTNQVLTSDSLNERQKNKIVEAISKADSVDEAKTIFNTLQGAVGASSKRTPKSLSEAVERRSSSLPRVTEAKTSDPATDRMRLLAGIVKK
jgi:hypothetical protein